MLTPARALPPSRGRGRWIIVAALQATLIAVIALLGACNLVPGPDAPSGRPTSTPLGTLAPSNDPIQDTPAPGGGPTRTRVRIIPSPTHTRIPTVTPTSTVTPGTPLPTATATV